MLVVAVQRRRLLPGLVEEAVEEAGYALLGELLQRWSRLGAAACARKLAAEEQLERR